MRIRVFRAAGFGNSRCHAPRNSQTDPVFFVTHERTRNMRESLGLTVRSSAGQHLATGGHRPWAMLRERPADDPLGNVSLRDIGSPDCMLLIASTHLVSRMQQVRFPSKPRCRKGLLQLTLCRSGHVDSRCCRELSR